MSDESRLSLVLERGSEDVHEPEFVSDVPLVSFEAFIARYRVFGWVRLDADRLTDLLNAHSELRLVNVMVEHLGDGDTFSADEAIVRRDELVAVRASGPRGDAARWRNTEPHAVLVEAGPFRIGGHVHSLPGVDPAARIRDGEPMIPLTEGWIEHRSAGGRQRRRVGTIIINRELAARIEPVE